MGNGHILVLKIGMNQYEYLKLELQWIVVLVNMFHRHKKHFNLINLMMITFNEYCALHGIFYNQY